MGGDGVWVAIGPLTRNWVAGGGGGGTNGRGNDGVHQQGSPGAGGNGGFSDLAPTNAVANTGSGGGGGSGGTTGANGSSGLVVLKIPAAVYSGNHSTAMVLTVTSGTINYYYVTFYSDGYYIA